MRLRATSRLVATVVTAALAVTACTSTGGGTPGPTPSVAPTAPTTSAAAPTEGDRRGGSFRFALGRDPEAIDPRFVADEEGRAVADALFDSLVALDDDLEVVPAAAERWEVNEDATEFTFHLRPGATFHDGTPVTAADFVRAFARMADGTATPRSYVAYKLAPIEGFDAAQAEGTPLTGVEAVDATTLVIRLRTPFAEFVSSLADPSLAPVPPAADAALENFGERPVGNGPFQMAEPWQHNQFIRVARWAEYPGEVALLDEVVFQIYADDPGLDGQYADLEAGQLHFAELPVAKLDTAIEQFGLSDDGYAGPGVLDGVSSTIYYYGFNTTRPPFDDPEVRRAVSLLIDRERIVDGITRETRQVADAIVPPSIPGARTGVCAACRFDPDEARALIGERVLEPIRILHNTGRTHEAIARSIASSLEQQLGVAVEVAAEDLQTYVQDLRAGEMEIFRLGWEADYPSPGSYLFPLFSSTTIGQDNLTRFSDPEVDAWLQQARGEQDTDARLALYQQVEDRVLDQVALAPVMFYEHSLVVAPNVRGFVYTAMGTVDLTAVWLDAET